MTKRPASQKSDLKPGMEVKNKKTGNFGEILGKDGELAVSGPHCVFVRTRILNGTSKGKTRKVFWLVDNLVIL